MTVTTIVTVDDVQSYLNLPDLSHADELQGFIDAATEIVEDIVGPVIARTVDEWRDGGTSIITPRVWPVLSVTSLTEYRSGVAYPLTLAASPALAATDTFTMTDRSGRIVRRDSATASPNFPAGDGTVHLVYVAGRASVPASVRMATLELIRHNYQDTQQGGRQAFGGTVALDDGYSNTSGYEIQPRVLQMLHAEQRPPGIG